MFAMIINRLRSKMEAEVSTGCHAAVLRCSAGRRDNRKPSALGATPWAAPCAAWPVRPALLPALPGRHH